MDVMIMTSTHRLKTFCAQYEIKSEDQPEISDYFF